LKSSWKPITRVARCRARAHRSLALPLARVPTLLRYAARTASLSSGLLRESRQGEPPRRASKCWPATTFPRRQTKFTSFPCKARFHGQLASVAADNSLRCPCRELFGIPFLDYRLIVRSAWLSTAPRYPRKPRKSTKCAGYNCCQAKISRVLSGGSRFPRARSISRSS
jgi:hypothetical protein